MAFALLKEKKNCKDMAIGILHFSILVNVVPVHSTGVIVKLLTILVLVRKSLSGNDEGRYWNCAADSLSHDCNVKSLNLGSQEEKFCITNIPRNHKKEMNFELDCAEWIFHSPDIALFLIKKASSFWCQKY